MEKFCTFYKSFSRIHWTTSAIVICAVPLTLTFILFHLTIFLFDDNIGYVVSNCAVCAVVGKDLLTEGGSVIDAAIGTMLCEGVMLPNRAGIGGGFTALMFYDGRIDSLTATPVVPAEYPEGFFNASSENIDGAMAGGVPGELHGYWELHQKYGILSWRRLFEPTIKLCEDGIPITEWLEFDIQRSSFYMYRSKTMRELFRVMQNESDGMTFKFLQLGKTLREIAKHGIDVFYRGEIGKDFIDDVRSDGGILNSNDLENYKSHFNEQNIMIRLSKKLRAYTTPLPSMGAVVALAMNIIRSLPNKDADVFWHMAIEAMKHAIGRSYSLADIQNESDERIKNEVNDIYSKMIQFQYAIKLRDQIDEHKIHNKSSYYGVKHSPKRSVGSSNICIFSPTGDAIVLTSSLMWDFQTFFWSRKTGIIHNNLIRNFMSTSIGELPPSYSSYIAPGKRAISPHAPVIALYQQFGRVYFAVGASGGETIPSQVITALISYCILGKNTFYAANSGFFHPDPMSNLIHFVDSVSSDSAFEESIFKYLNETGHDIRRTGKINPYTIRTCIGFKHKNPEGDFTNHEQGGVAMVQPSSGLNIFLVIMLIVITFIVLTFLVCEIVASEYLQ